MGVVSAFPRRDEVWLASLDPAHGHEMRKTRRCLVISPDEMNRNLATVIVAPMNRPRAMLHVSGKTRPNCASPDAGEG